MSTSELTSTVAIEVPSTARPEVAGRPGQAVLAAGLAAAWTYVCIALLYRERLFGIEVGPALALLLLLFGYAAALLLPGLRWARRLLAAGTMLNLGLALLVATITLLVVDTAYSVYANLVNARTTRVALSTDLRSSDPTVWHGELMPREYHPTSRRFVLFKPNVRAAAYTYGEFYNPTMLASSLLADSVLELRHVTYAIGPHGLRDTTALGQARTFALGDSFVFGYATDASAVWTNLLGAALGEPVYNLGVPSTGPRAQLMLLEHLLATQPDSMHVQRLLWMIFEGNDLENDYEESRPPAQTSGESPLAGTVLGALASLPGRMNRESILRMALHGELAVTVRSAAAARDAHHEVAGIPLSFPLYHSARWGYRLFNPEDMSRAGKPRSYLMSHRNRPRLDRTFEAMRKLSEAHGFQVLVIVAPSAARLYGPAFDDFTPVSPEPYFGDYVIDLARRQGFATLDLVRGLKPFAEKELLYYRDDHHWNARGNQVAAQLIQAALP